MRERAKTAVIISIILVTVLISCSDPSGPVDAGSPTPSILTVSLEQDIEGPASAGRAVSVHPWSPMDPGGKYSYQALAVWTQCPDDDFGWYAIYRSQSSGIAENPENADTCVIFSSVSSTAWTDAGISEGGTYYYVIRTVNDNDQDSWSNEEVIEVPPATPPEPSYLAGSYTGNGLFGQITLEWSQCPDGDFRSYRLYRSLVPGIETDPFSATLICEIDEAGTLTFQDNNVEGLTPYYYALETIDDSDLSSWSNEIVVTTPDLTPRLTVFFIDPSHNSYYSGDVILIKTPGSRFYLIDGGDRSGSWSCGVEKVLPLLDSLGADSLDGIVGTHPHSDHIGGLIGVLENVPVATVWDSGLPYTTSTYYDYLDAIDLNGSDFITPRRGDILEWDEDLTVECLHPVEPLGDNPNNASVVLRVTFQDVSFLFTGDLETEDGEDVVLDALAQGYITDISADVLKVGHHGSYTSTSIEFLSEVDPTYAAIEVGYGNPYGHPHDEVIDRLESYGAVIYRTDLDGTFIMTTDGTDLQVIP